MRRDIGLGLVICLLSASLFAGCARNLPYHDKAPSGAICASLTDQNCMGTYYRTYENFDLAFVEYSERGNAFNNERVNKVLDDIKAKEEESGVVIVVFVHGWTHNADVGDRDVGAFENILQKLSSREDILYGRRLVGVFVGWRGASIQVPLLQLMTFWDRKAVAEEVGKGAITDMLLQLDQIDNAKASNVLVIVGHSFGGAIVLSALSETLTERLITSQLKPTSESVRGVGDGVILLNPAIEANQALPLVEAALSKTSYPAQQDPLLMVISSDADFATHYAFPAGQTFGLLFTWRQADLERDYYVHRETDEPVPLKEEKLDAATVGNFAPFLTHRLSLEQTAPPQGDTAETRPSTPNIRLQRCSEETARCEARGLSKATPNTGINRLPDHYPLYVIKTDKQLMSGHSDIFNPEVVSVLTTVIDFQMRKSTDPALKTAPNILQDSAALNQRFQTFHSASP